MAEFVTYKLALPVSASHAPPIDLSRLSKMLEVSARNSRAIIETECERIYGPNWREIVRAAMAAEGLDFDG